MLRWVCLSSAPSAVRRVLRCHRARGCCRIHVPPIAAPRCRISGPHAAAERFESCRCLIDCRVSRPLPTGARACAARVEFSRRGRRHSSQQLGSCADGALHGQHQSESSRNFQKYSAARGRVKRTTCRNNRRFVIFSTFQRPVFAFTTAFGCCAVAPTQG